MTTEPVEPSPGDAPPQPAAPAAPPAPPAPPVPPQPVAASDAIAPEAVAPDAVVTGPPGAFVPDLLAVGPEPAPRVPRRPRPVLLAVCGLVLGVLGGGGVGYAIQAQRPPTPLPPLQVALPSYPAATVDPTAFAAEQPQPLAIDGDLRKLLLTAPEGSKPWGENPDKPSWVSAGDLAEHTGDAVREFKDLNSRGFRRAVEVDWQKDDVKYRVSLIQYAPEHAGEAKSRATVFRTQPFEKGANGGYKVFDQPNYWSDSKDPYYYGHAVAQRGTVVMEVEIFGAKPVTSNAVEDLAKQQWERLI
ncbi:hypothetical protein ACFXDE_37360 [Kitasatospora sp. NPDC059408]|uniref:hypothetical protein n=1 Tax=Kitasatospora sp. NPDC059408 TaxID=3346823 RepID=UPI0036B687C5